MDALEEAVTRVANQFYEQKDIAALELLVGLRSRAIELNPELAQDTELQVSYDEPLMGPLDTLRELGWRILRRWNKELNNLVCGEKVESAERAKLLNALSLGESAVIATVVSILLAVGVAPAIAAVVAPLVVKRFIWPAKDELCVAWREAIDADALAE